MSPKFPVVANLSGQLKLIAILITITAVSSVHDSKCISFAAAFLVNKEKKACSPCKRDRERLTLTYRMLDPTFALPLLPGIPRIPRSRSRRYTFDAARLPKGEIDRPFRTSRPVPAAKDQCFRTTWLSLVPAQAIRTAARSQGHRTAEANDAESGEGDI